jgi:hypothetical protein
MLTAEERAMEIFNRAVKTCIHLSCDMRKEEARHIALNNIIAAKEAIYELTTISDIPVMHVKRTLDYYNKIKTIIEAL